MANSSEFSKMSSQASNRDENIGTSLASVIPKSTYERSKKGQNISVSDRSTSLTSEIRSVSNKENQRPVLQSSSTDQRKQPKYVFSVIFGFLGMVILTSIVVLAVIFSPEEAALEIPTIGPRTKKPIPDFDTTNTKITLIPIPTPSNGSQYHGTVHDAENFDAFKDAQLFESCYTTYENSTNDCETKMAFKILCFRSNRQRQKIIDSFHYKYRRNLMQEFSESFINENYYHNLFFTLLTPFEQIDAMELNRAFKNMSELMYIVTEILTTRNNSQINSIKIAYELAYEEDIKNVLQNVNDSHHAFVLDALTNIAQEFYYYETFWSTSDIVFQNATSRFVYMNPAQLLAAVAAYRNLSGHDFQQSIDEHFTGDIKEVLTAIVNCAINKPAYLAEQVYKSLSGIITSHLDLIRIVVTRSETDMVEIKQAYLENFRQSIKDALKNNSEITGVYLNGLLALLGEYNL